MLTISDEEIIRIPIKDNGERLVDLREYSEFIFLPEEMMASKSSFHVRESVAVRLRHAQNNLQGMRLFIIEGHRPLSVQEQIYNEYLTDLKMTHPGWTDESLYIEVSKYVSPPSIIPPHSTGGALDLTLYTIDGTEVDMGARVNATPEENQNAGFTAADNISLEAKQNRKVLVDAMSSAGFINYTFEFWHWSYGDRYWAHETGANHALYGSV